MIAVLTVWAVAFVPAFVLVLALCKTAAIADQRTEKLLREGADGGGCVEGFNLIHGSAN